MDKPTKKEFALDVLGTVVLDALALAGIVSVIPYAADDLVGTIAVALIFAALGVAYTAAVIAARATGGTTGA